MSEEQAEVATATPAKTTRPKFPVQMTDGRTVEFAEGAKAQKETILDENGLASAVRFDFSNGDTRTIVLNDLPSSILAQAVAHGISQKLGDSYASKKVSPDDAVQAIDKIVEALKNGDWSIRSSEVGESMAGIGVLTAACSKVYQISIDRAKEVLKGLTAKEKASLRVDPAVSAAIQAIEAERLAKSGGVDVDSVKAKFAV